MVFAGSLIFLVAAIFFVAGLILLWQGWRGLPEFSEPYCRKCGYDVRGLNWVEPARKCPECGSDLAAAGAVRFGKYRRRPRRMALGACVLGLVLFLPFGLRMAVMLLNRPPAAQSTPSLLATLATNGDDAFTWQELTRRYNSGRLSRGQVATAVNHLIAWLNANPSRRRRPLAWSGDLVKTAIADGVVSGEELARLSDAFYGPAPEVKVRQRLRQGKKLKFEIEGRIAWNLPGLQHLVALRSVSLDGKPVEILPEDSQRSSKHYLSGARYHSIGGTIPTPPAGKYELQFDLDWGLTDEKAKLDPRYEGRPGQADRWPKTMVKQSKTVKVPLEVVPPDVPVVGLITDPKRDPSRSISVTGIQVIPRGGRLELRAQFDESRSPPVPVCVSAEVEVEGKVHKLGRRGIFEHGSVSGGSSALVDSLAPTVKTATVILRPDAEWAEDDLHSWVNEIWGKPIILENVPLERYDLEEAENAK